MRAIVLLGLLLGACDSDNAGKGNDLSGTADGDGGEMDLSGAITCGLVGEACAGSSACCSNNCDANTHICLSSTAMCKSPGDSCSQPTDCCGLICNSGTCGGACTGDNAACTDSTACCSGQCVAGACKPLNNMCLTS